MRYLNVGDRVKVKAKGIADARELKHKEAIVVSSYKSSITLAFFDWSGGHGGNGSLGYISEVREFVKPNNIWYCHIDEVDLITEYTPVSKRELICKKVKYLENKFKERNTPCLAA